MTRINTNISALTAQQNLANSNNQLQTTLTRLSTGLRINSAADDPAGMIAATDLGSNIASTQQAISNSQVASQMISTADSALSQISSLLTTINGLITSAANTASMSSSQIAANQLQIDSSLDAINRISKTTTFQGRNLLDGSLGFLTTGTSANYTQTVQNLQVNQANLGSNASIPVNINVTTAATQASVTNSFTSGAVAKATFTFANGSITIDAPTGGAQYNNTTLQIKQSAGQAAGTASASYDATSNSLVVTVNNGGGQTLSSVIAAAIADNTPFTVDATNSPSGYYLATDGTSTFAAKNVTTTDGGSLTIESKNPNASWNGTNIQINTNGTSATPTVSFSGTAGSGTLTIQVSSSGTTSLQAIANAINNSTDTNVQQFSATLNTAGNIDPSLDGNTSAAGSTAAASYNVGAATISLTSSNTGLAFNGLAISVGASAAANSATYSSAANGGKGQLTINIQNGQTLTSAQLQTLLTTGLQGTVADVAAFQKNFNVAVTGGAVIAAGGGIQGISATSTETTAGAAGVAEVVTAALNDGVNTPNIVMTANATGALPGGQTAPTIVVSQATNPNTTGTTAAYVASANGGSGELDITLGYGQTYTQAAFEAAVNNAVTAMSNNAAFAGKYTLSFTNDANGLSTAATNISTNATTAGGTNTIHALGGTLTGGGVSALFSGGTGSSALTGNLVVELGSDVGSQQFSFVSGTTVAQVIQAINQQSDATGVNAQLNANNQLELYSTNYGSSAFVNVNVVSDGGNFGSNLNATHAAGTDIQATVNDVQATGSGNTVSMNTPNLAFSATLAAGVAANTQVSFNINGGGALFQLGAVVNSGQQAHLGIQSVDSSSLGGTAGRLYEIGSGQDASLTSDTAKAAQIVQAAQDAVTSLRGRLGAFQTETVDTDISTLTDAVTNLTAAQSNIQDANFAAESANVTREQILVQSGTTVLGIANSNPSSVLSLLQRAAQV